MVKSVSIIGSAGIPARYGGFETLAEQLSIRLINNYSVSVACSKPIYKENEQSENWKGVCRVFIPLNPNGLSSIFYDIYSIFKLITTSDCLIILGSSAGLFFPLIRLFQSKKVILYHPDGLEWKRQKWNLFIKNYLKLSSFTARQFAHKIIIDNEELIPYYYRIKHKLVHISYGGDHYPIIENIEKKDYWLTIARAEAENNLEIIAESFAENKKEQWYIISNYTNTEYGKKLFRKYSNFHNITFFNADYRSDFISRMLCECKGYIHGHSVGGTNPSLVAAMWHKIPIICHDNVFNRSTTQNLASFYRNKAELLSLITQETKNNNLYNYKLYTYATQYYSWNHISAKYQEALMVF